MNASTTKRQRHAARRNAGALCAMLVLLTATAPGVYADSPPDQTISFGAAPTGVVVGGTGFSVSATATSGLAVAYSSTTPSVCTVGAATGALTLLAAGTCTIAADQAGDGTWAPAPQVTQDVAVGPASLTPQTITFGAAPTGVVVGATGKTVSATATSGLAVAYSSTTPSVCTVGAATGALTLLAAGTCTIAADQAGDGTWAPAPQVTQDVAVGPASLTPQTITFGAAPTGVVVGATGKTVSATATSGLAVAYSSTTPSVCTVGAATGALAPRGRHLHDRRRPGRRRHLGPGAPGHAGCRGRAREPHSADHHLRRGADRRRGRGDRQDGQRHRHLGPGRGLQLDHTVGLHGRAATAPPLLAAGTCTIAADQAGDGTWAPAPQVTQDVAVGPASLTPQTITFGAAPTGVVVGATGKTVSATATSGLAVAYSSTTPSVCTVGAATGALTLLAAGTCTIAADQAGDGTWAPAPQVQQSLTVGVTVPPPPATLPTLTVTADPKSRPFGVANPALTATISGFVDGQTLETSGVTGSPSCTTTATLVSPAGAYPITCDIGTLASAAYAFAFAPGTLTVVRGVSSVTLSTSTTVFETSTPVTFIAAVEPGVTGAIPSGSLLFTIDGVAGPAVPLDAGGRGSVTVTWTTPGVKSVEASYAGDVSFAAPGTASAAPSVVANTARTAGVGVSGSTFYPIVDGWRDAVTARGIRSERLALAIEVRSAAGAIVRRHSAGTAAGAYAWAWNGRTSKGVLVPAGRYTIVQTLTDPYGLRPRRTVTSDVTVSLRKIRWTTKAITASPGPRCFQFSSGDGVGSYSCSSTAPLLLAGNSGAWPAVGYEFRLPSAAVYRSIRVEVQGTPTGRQPTIGLHDWTLGSAWGQLYRGDWARRAISPTATRWSGVATLDIARYVSSRRVRAYVDGGGRLAGAFTFQIARARLVVSVGTFQ